MMQLGVQLHLPTHGHVGAVDLVELGRHASARGFSQIWVTDNMGSRHLFAVLAALACRTTTRLGAAVLVQYLRSPTESAAAMVTVGELAGERGLDIAIGAGNPFVGSMIVRPSPIRFMRETVTFLRAALSGQAASTADFPLLTDYFHYQPDTLLQSFPSRAADVRVLGGGNGPLGMKLAGQLCDGALMGWTLLPAMRLGKLEKLLDIADAAAAEVGKASPIRRVGEVKVSVARAHHEARRWVAGKAESTATRCVSLKRRGYSDQEFAQLGIDPAAVDMLVGRAASGLPLTDVAAPTDAMIDACVIAGDPVYCRERLQIVIERAQALGFEQLIFSELGPDPREGLRLLADQVLPALS